MSAVDAMYLRRRITNALALLLLGFVLFIVTFIVLAIARFMLMQLSRREGN